VPKQDEKEQWIHIGPEGNDLANLRDAEAEQAKHRIDLCEQAVAIAREKGLLDDLLAWAKSANAERYAAGEPYEV